MFLLMQSSVALAGLVTDSGSFVWDLDSVFKVVLFVAAVFAVLITLVMYLHNKGLAGAYALAKEARNNVPVQDAIETAATQYIGVDTMQNMMKYVIATVVYASNFDKTPEGQAAAKDFITFLSRISDGKPNVPENDPSFLAGIQNAGRPEMFYKSIDDSNKAV